MCVWTMTCVLTISWGCSSGVVVGPTGTRCRHIAVVRLLAITRVARVRLHRYGRFQHQLGVASCSKPWPHWLRLVSASSLYGQEDRTDLDAAGLRSSGGDLKRQRKPQRAASAQKTPVASGSDEDECLDCALMKVRTLGRCRLLSTAEQALLQYTGFTGPSSGRAALGLRACCDGGRPRTTPLRTT